MVIQNTKRFFAALAVCSSFMMLAACGGDSSGKDGDCPDGQQKVRAGGVEQCAAACTMGMCTEAGKVCVSDFCVNGGAANNGANNGPNNGVNNGANNGPNNGVNNGVNNGTTGTNNGTTGGNNGVNPEFQQICEDAADKLWGSCVAISCPTLEAQIVTDIMAIGPDFIAGDGTPGSSCPERMAADVDFETAVRDISIVTCDSEEVIGYHCLTLGLTNDLGCACPTPATTGGPCVDDPACGAEGFGVQCIVQDPTTGLPPGGQCTSICNAPTDFPAFLAYENANCGTDNFCQVIDDGQGQRFGICIDNCSADAECRTGYICEPSATIAHPTIADGFALGRSCTTPSATPCQADADCAQQAVLCSIGVDCTCNLASNRCEVTCEGTVDPADATTQTWESICTGAGMTCNGVAGSRVCTPN